MGFLTADVLNQKFYTEGAFYQIEVEGEIFHCRGLARICRRDVKTNISNALVVMINPGSSQPTDREYSIPPYNENLMEIPMVEAKSDQTQQQLMRLMECRGWDMISIINLSDLKTGSLAEFQELLQAFKEKGNNEHSIFSPSRRKQIYELLSKKTKIIIGWGVQTIKKEKMKEVLPILEEHGEIFGIPHATYPYYLHPKPALIENRIKWLENMNKLLDSDTQSREEDISTSIVRDILQDIHGRIGLERELRNLDPKIQVEMYEKWIEIVSNRLYQEGLIDEK